MHAIVTCKRRISLVDNQTWQCPIQQSHAPQRVCSTVQRHQSAERPILRQISSLIYPKIQRRQVIMNVLQPSFARPPRWSPPVLWRRLEDGLAIICPHRVLVSCLCCPYYGPPQALCFGLVCPSVCVCVFTNRLAVAFSSLLLYCRTLLSVLVRM